MSKIALIIQREYVTRVRKRTFLIASILGPLFFAGIIFIPAFLASAKNEHQRIVVVDETKTICGALESDATVQYDYNYCTINIDAVKKIFADSAHVSVLHIKASEQLTQVQLYSKDDPGNDVVSSIANQLSSMLEKEKMKKNNLDESIIQAVHQPVQVQDIVGEQETNAGYNMALGYISSFLIYLFILLYSVQVMRGVMEEKTSRIVEVIISSVRPFQLMMGKVIGVGLVGLTQFLIWVLLGWGVYHSGSAYIQAQQINPQNATTTEQTVKSGRPVQDDKTTTTNMAVGSRSTMFSMLDNVDTMLRATNWMLVLGGFIFYFLGGYVLFSAMFAALGSAVDQDTDTQQFMLPVTMPLILSIVVMGGIITNPHSSVAVWFSIIPFTSPIAMMARLPFGVPIWQMVLSMVLLVASIFGTVWLAGRIYRIGLLMYGKKITYRELGKWIFYK